MVAAAVEVEEVVVVMGKERAAANQQQQQQLLGGGRSASVKGGGRLHERLLVAGGGVMINGRLAMGGKGPYYDLTSEQTRQGISQRERGGGEGEVRAPLRWQHQEHHDQ